MRSPSAAALAIWCGVALCCALLFVPLPMDRSPITTRAFRDFLHLPFFALLVVAVYIGLRISRPAAGRTALLVATVLVAAAIGAVSEWAQVLGSRTSSWRDFAHNLLGIGLASATIMAGRCRRRRALVIAAVAAVWFAAAVPALAPWAAAREALQRQAASFPQLGDFEDEWESLLWSAQGEGGTRPTSIEPTGSHATRGSNSLKVEATGASWAGVRLRTGPSLPWGKSGSLQFDLYNPQDPFELGVRVDLADGRRFSGQLRIVSGINRCELAPRAMAGKGGGSLGDPPADIDEIVFHLGASAATRRFFLDNVRLE